MKLSCRWLFPVAIQLLLPAGAQAGASRTAGADTLAVIGTKVITSQEFAARYGEKLRGIGFADSRQSREGYLRNLVDDEVLIAQARIERLDRTPAARREFTRIQTQRLLNAYSDEHISPTIEVADADLRELFVRMNTKVNVRHLYAMSRTTADSLYAQLQRGKTFEELATVSFHDPRLRDNGGSLGYIGFDETDPAFEDAAYNMKVGEISTPVKTVEGYSIIRVDGIRSDPLLTETDFLKSKERLERFARKRKYEAAVTRYTAEQRAALDIRFNEQVMARLLAALQRETVDPLNETAAFSLPRMDETAVRTTAGPWDLQRVIEALRSTTEAQRRWIRTLENLEDVVAGLIVRDQIVRAARREGLDSDQSFRRDVEFDFDTYLMTALEKRLRAAIVVSGDSLRAYYDQNLENFRSEPRVRISVILVDTAAVADAVEQSLRRGSAFDSLAKRYSIQRATAERGGDAGEYPGDQLENLQRGLSRLAVGEWAGPFLQDGKYLFLQCRSRTAAVQRSFEESMPEINEHLVEMRWPSVRARAVEAFKKTVACRVYPERLMAISLALPKS
jgi:parvulin-like peptidyl-prolyl isomerase